MIFTKIVILLVSFSIISCDRRSDLRKFNFIRNEFNFEEVVFIDPSSGILNDNISILQNFFPKEKFYETYHINDRTNYMAASDYLRLINVKNALNGKEKYI